MLPFYTYLFKHAIPITVGPEWHATHEPIRNVYTFLGDNSSILTIEYEDILNADGFDSDILDGADYYPYHYIDHSIKR